MGAVRGSCWRPGPRLQEAGRQGWGRIGQEVAGEPALWRDCDGLMRKVSGRGRRGGGTETFGE